MAGRPAVKANAKRILTAFSGMYEEYYEKPFYTNYGMIVMADKISDYYTLPQIMEAMNFYFSRSGKKDFYDFLNSLDKIFPALKTQQEEDSWLSELEKETSQLVKDIHKKRRG